MVKSIDVCLPRAERHCDGRQPDARPYAGRPTSTTDSPTSPLDADGQGDAQVCYVFAAHRAVVDVDLDLGLGVVEIATSHDVGKVLNPVICGLSRT